MAHLHQRTASAKSTDEEQRDTSGNRIVSPGLTENEAELVERFDGGAGTVAAGTSFSGYGISGTIVEQSAKFLYGVAIAGAVTADPWVVEVATRVRLADTGLSRLGTLVPASCTLGGQPIVSLTVTESADADYDTASCVTVGSAGGKGDVVESIEAAVSTGYWEVEDRVLMYSDRTLKWDPDTGEPFHLPLVSYSLRRKGYMAARATISRDMVAGSYPPRFCSSDYYWALVPVLANRIFAAMGALGVAADADAQAAARAALTAAVTDQTNRLGALRPVGAPSEIVAAICSWVGLSVTGASLLTAMPNEYTPAGKTVITALKEIAGWSGCSVRLHRSGALEIYNWSTAFGGGSAPHPANVFSEEQHDGLYPTNQFTVVGTSYSGGTLGQWDHSTTPPTWVPWDPTTGTVANPEAISAVESTAKIQAADGEYCVEERVEVKDYNITSALAQSLARGRAARVLLAASIVRRSGPGLGSQTYTPVTHRLFSVSRSLEWTGSKYRYTVTMDAPSGSLDSIETTDVGTVSGGGGTTTNNPIEDTFGGGDPVVQNQIIHERRMTG